MTTIAADLEGMAADSLCVMGDVCFHVTKIMRLKDGSLLATAGTDVYTVPFEQAMLHGKLTVNTDTGSDVSALHLTKDGLFVYDNSWSPSKILSGKCAIGSGAQAALSWLLNGATPEEAVRKAAEVDVNTGGPIQHETIKAKRAKRTPE